MNHEAYMRRCLQLASLGAGHVAPNPMVGAVLVFGDRIVGEGYHHRYGEAHAEVNCIKDFEQRFASGEWTGLGVLSAGEVLARATIYVSLEPCAHFGKTPPCADLIIKKGIPRVVVGVRDPFPEVDGKGVEKLKAAGVEVIMPVLEAECRDINRRFFTYHTQGRPYVILKWAQSADGYIGREGERVAISGRYANVLVHRWRSEEAAIMVGARTALADDPVLTTRHWPGTNPLRVVLDPQSALLPSLKVLDEQAPTILIKSRQLPDVLKQLYARSIQSVLVEGGARLLGSFIDEGIWDELRVISSRSVILDGGISAPVIPEARLSRSFELGDDLVYIYDSFAR